MITAESLRKEFMKKLYKLQRECPHERSDLMPHAWGGKNFIGPAAVCLRCEKVVDRGGVEFER